MTSIDCENVMLRWESEREKEKDWEVGRDGKYNTVCVNLKIHTHIRPYTIVKIYTIVKVSTIVKVYISYVKKLMESWLERYPWNTTDWMPIGRREGNGTEAEGYRIW